MRIAHRTHTCSGTCGGGWCKEVEPPKTRDREALDIRSLWIEADGLVGIDRAMAILPVSA
jgi:hypothetical protein